jgi:hypothetical protein
MSRPRRLAALCVGLLLTVTALESLAQARAGVQQRPLYRYVDDRGVTVIDFHIPPQHAHRGYQVLGVGGRVIDEIPPTLSPEEREAQPATAETAAERADRELRERKRDESLPLRYSTIADIDAARDRSLRELRVRINIERSNIRSLRQQIENEQAAAADLERRGIEVPAENLLNIRKLQVDLERTERSIAEREREIEVTKASYAADAARFAELAPLVEQLGRGSTR